MKFKSNILVTGMACALIFSSCNDQMEYKEHTNYDKDYMELNFSNVSGLVTDIYSKLEYDHGSFGGGMLASASDEAEHALSSNQIHDFYNGVWGPANAKQTIWETSYSGIQACNFFLEEYPGLTFPELQFNDDYQPQMFRYLNYENEVRFLRAYFYFNLIRQYGDAPFFTTTLSVDEVNSLPRVSYSRIVDFIVQECDAIVNKIPADYTNLGSMGLDVPDTGRANRLAVLALKARALLYAASPLFNTGNNNDLWKKAAEANKAVLDSCAKYGYQLTAYTSIWGTDNWTSKEAIFVRRIGALNNLETRNLPAGVEGGGTSPNCPTQNLVDAYQMKQNGKFWNEAGSGYDESNPYADRDPRFAMTVAKNGDTKWPIYNTLPVQTYFGGANAEPLSGATTTGYYLKKLLDGNLDFSGNKTPTSRHSWITYRLGEFYLNYAEAVFRYLGSADAKSGNLDLSATEAVNVIRTRAGVNMPELSVGLSNDEFWKQYTNERMVELAFEGHRFWDVRRWKEAGKYFNSVTRMKITKNSDETYTYTRQTVNRQWEDKMYFFPIPQSERMKNPNLVQNPGWE